MHPLLPSATATRAATIRKRLRPVASGEIGPRGATLTGVRWLVAGIALCVVISPPLAAVGVGYVALTLSYSWLGRNLPMLDLTALAAGSGLRTGAAPSGPTPSGAGTRISRRGWGGDVVTGGDHRLGDAVAGTGVRVLVVRPGFVVGT